MFRGRFSGRVTLGSRFRGPRQNSSFLRFLAVFLGYSTQFWVPGTTFGARDPSSWFRGRRENSSFSWAIAHCFGFRGRFSGPVTTGTRFRGRRQNSSFSRFLAVFVGYSTLFWVPGTIFGDRAPRYTVSGATSKIIVFAFSGCFRGPWHSVLCSRDDFRGP